MRKNNFLNQRKLNEAFATSPNVILIFSVNKSSKFQGFAKMDSLIMNDQTSPFWKDTGINCIIYYDKNLLENIKLGGSFQIRWLRYSDLSFTKIAHLRNRFNNNEPIKKSRDTQVSIIFYYILFKNIQGNSIRSG